MDEQKVREAIEFLQRKICTLGAQKEYDEYCNPVHNETLDLAIGLHEIAIEALEKQLPKKVVDKSLVKDDGIAVGYVGKCPCCNEIIEYTTNVCDCGQRLDWSE